jgi:hypothetical protein
MSRDLKSNMKTKLLKLWKNQLITIAVFIFMRELCWQRLKSSLIYIILDLGLFILSLKFSATIFRKLHEKRENSNNSATALFHLTPTHSLTLILICKLNHTSNILNFGYVCFFNLLDNINKNIFLKLNNFLLNTFSTHLYRGDFETRNRLWDENKLTKVRELKL